MWADIKIFLVDKKVYFENQEQSRLSGLRLGTDYKNRGENSEVGRKIYLEWASEPCMLIIQPK